MLGRQKIIKWQKIFEWVVSQAVSQSEGRQRVDTLTWSEGGKDSPRAENLPCIKLPWKKKQVSEYVYPNVTLIVARFRLSFSLFHTHNHHNMMSIIAALRLLLSNRTVRE